MQFLELLFDDQTELAEHKWTGVMAAGCQVTGYHLRKTKEANERNFKAIQTGWNNDRHVRNLYMSYEKKLNKQQIERALDVAGQDEHQLLRPK